MLYSYENDELFKGYEYFSKRRRIEAKEHVNLAGSYYFKIKNNNSIDTIFLNGYVNYSVESECGRFFIRSLIIIGILIIVLSLLVSFYVWCSTKIHYIYEKK